MRVRSGLLLFLIMALVTSCFNEPKFSIIPSIEFGSLVYKPAANSQSLDSLILTISFKDGDGDLGLDSTDKYSPFESAEYVVFSGADAPGTIIYFPNGQTVTNPAQTANGYDTLLAFKDRRLPAPNPNDTLPKWVAPYCCTRYNILQMKSGDSTVYDTLYYILNRDYYNIFVTISVQQADKAFTPYTFTDTCTTACYPPGFNGRFPVLSSDLSRSAPLEGKIRYAMTSYGIGILFGNNKLEITVQIQDRARHKSNPITYGPFTLTSI